MKETYINHMRKFWYNFLFFSGGKFFNHGMYYGKKNMYISSLRKFHY